MNTAPTNVSLRSFGRWSFVEGASAMIGGIGFMVSSWFAPVAVVDQQTISRTHDTPACAVAPVLVRQNNVPGIVVLDSTCVQDRVDLHSAQSDLPTSAALAALGAVVAGAGIVGTKLGRRGQRLHGDALIPASNVPGTVMRDDVDGSDFSSDEREGFDIDELDLPLVHVPEEASLDAPDGAMSLVS